MSLISFNHSHKKAPHVITVNLYMFSFRRYSPISKPEASVRLSVNGNVYAWANSEAKMTQVNMTCYVDELVKTQLTLVNLGTTALDIEWIVRDFFCF